MKKIKMLTGMVHLTSKHQRDFFEGKMRIKSHDEEPDADAEAEAYFIEGALDTEYRPDYFSMAVHNAVLSILEDGISSFTARDVVNLLNGDINLRIPPRSQLAKDVEKELRSMSEVVVYIDLRRDRQQGRVFHRLGGEKEIEERVLPIKKDVLDAGGEAWEAEKMPPFYAYAKDTNQMDIIPLQYNQSERKLALGTILVREYLYFRILLIKGKQENLSNYRKISVLTMAEFLYTGLEGEHDKRKTVPARMMHKAEETATEILKGWENAGLIESWQLLREGDSIMDDFFLINPETDRIGNGAIKKETVLLDGSGQDKN